MGSIQCNACGVWNGYLLIKPKICRLCGRPVNSPRLPEQTLEKLMPQYLRKVAKSEKGE